MSRYKAYAEYKDSGVEGIGEIPSDWDMWKITHACPYVASGTTPKSDGDVYYGGETLWVTTGELREDLIFDTQKKVTDKALIDMSTLRLHPEGSVAIAMYGATIGRLGIFGRAATTNQACCVMPPSKILQNKYLFYWLFATRQEIINLSSGGGQPNVNQEKIASLKVSAPTYDLQVKIANFLDHETAKIDTLIAKQQGLIKLLKEKRQAVISHAVTKGLNPNAPMRDSGVEWLGEVPAHWDVSRIGFLANKIGSGKTPKGGSEIYKDEGVLFLRSQNIYDDGLHIQQSESVYITSNIHEEMKGTQVQSGDVLLNITGGSIGRSCLVPVNFCEANVNQHVCILRFEKKISEYLAFIMKSNSIQAQIDSCQTGGNREGLNFDQISKFFVVIPPAVERTIILEFIRKSVFQFDQMEAKARSVIELMQERRTALISAAVTGKIDVRDWQPASILELEDVTA